MNDFNGYMNSIKLKSYKPHDKFICDRSKNKKYSVHCRHLIFLLGTGLILKGMNRVTSFKQKPWLAHTLTKTQNESYNRLIQKQNVC